MSVHTPLILALTGPTASGKTDLALALAERRPTGQQLALISMDSAMVYRGMDIGTAKPSPAIRGQYPHALVDIRDPAEAYSVADFLKEADLAVQAALQANRLPVLVGGTMLYLRAFREGLAGLPGADPALRAAIDEEGRRRGWLALYEELRRVDPRAAEGIHPNNRVRIQRALEVYRLTGQPISQAWTGAGPQARTDQQDVGRRLSARLLEVAILPASRRSLDGPIERRLHAMIEAGLIDEVAALKARGDLSLETPSMRAVGYRQVWEYLDGPGDIGQLVERAAAATRSLAKRQVTWLRRWPGVHRIAPAPVAGQLDELCGLIESA